MRSFLAPALCLALVHTSEARLPKLDHDLVKRDGQPSRNWLSSLFRKDLAARQEDDSSDDDDSNDELICQEDNVLEFVGGLDETFCSQFMNYEDVMEVVQFTPRSTFTDLYTTSVRTMTQYTEITPGGTVTATVTPGQPQVTAQADISRVLGMFRRQQNNANAQDDDSLSASFSSACNCLGGGGATTTSTFTNPASIFTQSAFARASTTEVRTLTAASSDRIVTVTTSPSDSLSSSIATSTGTSTGSSAVSSPTSATSSTSDDDDDDDEPTGTPEPSDEPTETPEPSDEPEETDSTPSTTSSGPNPTPTAPIFNCPGANGTIVSQMIGNERFDYAIYCDTVLADANFYDTLSYSSFGECVGACSVANRNFDSPVCQGVSFFETGADGEDGNCFLKSTTDFPRPAVGFDTALLQRIAIGVSDNDTAGTGTSSAPFILTTRSRDPGDVSSSMSSFLSNSSQSMPMITPGPGKSSTEVVVTDYSTLISLGETFSTGTGFTTYFSSDGTWYSSFYTSYTLSWEASTTVFGPGTTSVSAGTSTSTATQTFGGGGQYNVTTTTTTVTEFDGGYTVETVIETITYNNGGNQVSSTATTNIISYETGGSGGGIGGGESGGPIETAVSTATISGNGTTSTSVVSSAITNTNGTSFSTGTLIPIPGSSGVFPTGGSNGTTVISSGTAVSTVVNPSGTGFSSGTLIPVSPPSSNGTLTISSGTRTGTATPPTDEDTTADPTDGTGTRTVPVPTGNVTISTSLGTAPPTGVITITNSNGTFTISSGTRTGTASRPSSPTNGTDGTAIPTGPSNSTLTGPTGTGVRPPVLTTSPPTTTCPEVSVQTTTVTSTAVVYGCYDYCCSGQPPGSGGGYGYGDGPDSFGPPVLDGENDGEGGDGDEDETQEDGDGA